eukprot:scaffold39010_cov25-Tisochrysis_lutea.AAC.3
MDDADISQAKMQVQGQMAAQYIQEVMQVRCAATCPLRRAVPPTHRHRCPRSSRPSASPSV